jgi:hypothetical protein
MEILSKLLNEMLNKRLNRLENRNKFQIADLKLAKTAYTQMDKNISNIKILPHPIRNSRTPLKTLKRDVSADVIINKKYANKNGKNNNKPNYMKPLNKSRTMNRYEITKSAEPTKPRKNKKVVVNPTGAIPSYMQGTASNSNKEKAKIHNQYYNLRVQKEKDLNSNRNTMEKNRSKTPEPNVNKKFIKKSDNNTNKNNRNNSIKNSILETNNNINTKQTNIEEINDIKKVINNTVSIINKHNEIIENINETKFIIENNSQIINNNAIINNNENNISKNEEKKLNLFENDNIFEIICNYLDDEDKLNLFLISKKYLPKILDVIENIYKKFKNINNITIYTINDKIEKIKLAYNENLESEMPFKINEGSEKAIQLLNEDYYGKSFKKKIIENEKKEIFLVYKIFFQFLKDDIVKIKDNNIFWKETCDYINKNSNGRIGDFIINKGKEFDFTAENLYKIKKLVSGNEEKMKNKYYSERDGGTGLFVFLIKDALEYCGLIENKNKSCPKIMLNYYEHVQNLNNKILNYINELKNKVKI